VSSIKREIIKGSIWTSLGQILVLSLSLVTNIWLARLLSPIDFGRVGIIMFFISLGYVLSEGGLSGALIRKKEVSNIHYSTLGVFNLLISIIFCLTIICCADFVSIYYNDGALKLPLIISSTIIIINALQFVKLTQLYIELKFKEKAILEFISVLISSIVSIILAYKGAGIWAIITYNLLKSVIMTICLYINNSNFVGLRFDINVFKDIYSFGVNTSFSSILTLAFDNIYPLVIGKYFNLVQVGFYFQAKRLLEVPSSILTTLSNGPIYSGLSKIQHNKDEFTQGYIRSLNILMSFSGLIVLFIFIFSKDIILIIFGNKWFESIFYLKVLSISFLFYIQDVFNKVVFKVYNQTRLMLKLDFIKKIIQLIGVVIAIYVQDINILLVNYILTLCIGYLITSYYSKGILESKNYVEQKNFFYVAIIITVLLIFSEYVSVIVNNYLVSYPLFLIIIMPLYFLIIYKLDVFNIRSFFVDVLQKKIAK
jgi:O-antigen/teichoic acid export membrane protein